MSDANVSVGFTPNTAATENAIARLQQQMQTMQEKMKQGSASTSRAMSEDMRRWQKANDEAMSKSVASAQRREMAPARIRAAEIRKSEMAAAEIRNAVPDPTLLDTATAGMMRYVGAAAVAAGAVKLIAAEWNNVIERQQKAGQASITFEQALGEATLNVGSVYDPAKMKKRALEISAKTGVDPSTAVQAISLAIKSGGASNADEAERLANAAEVAAQLSPRATAEKLSETAGSIASYMARTGATAQQAGGVLLSMQSKSNIADPNKAMAAAGPTLANMLAQGASTGMSQALMPALSQAIEDTQGDVSSLAATQFTYSLTEQFGQREGFKGKANIPDLAIAAMRQNPALAREFFETGLQNPETGRAYGKPELGRGKAETFFRAISGDETLAGDKEIIGSYVKQFEDYRRLAIGNQEAGQFYNQTLAQVRGATPNLQADRVFKGAADRIRIEGSDAAQGITREGLQEVLQSAGVGETRRRLMMADFELNARSGRLPFEFAENMLRKEAGTQTGDFEKSFTFGIQTNWLSEKFMEMTTEVTEERKAVAKSLVEAAEAIRELKAIRPRDRNGQVENN